MIICNKSIIEINTVANRKQLQITEAYNIVYT